MRGLLSRASGLDKTAFLLGFFTFLSQVLALFRDRLLAGRFGTGGDLDIYYAAFKIPDLIYVTVASFVSVTVLIPILARKLLADQKAAKEFLDQVLTAFLIIILSIELVIYFLMPYLTHLVAPGFGEAAQSQLILLSRVLLLSPILLGLSNLLGSVTQSLSRFLVFSLTPVLYNLGIILGILFFYPSFGLLGLTFGVILGAFLHMAIQMPGLYARSLLPRPVLNVDWRKMREIIRVSIPRSLTLALGQFVFLFLNALASLMSAGSIALLNLSFNLQSVPLAIIGVSYSVAAFPELARLREKGEKRHFYALVSGLAKRILFWSLPVTLFFLLFSLSVVRLVLNSGRFSVGNAEQVAASLFYFSLSLTAQSLALLYVRAYYAMGYTRKPLVISLLGSVLTIILAYFGKEASHLSLAYSAGMIFGAAIFYQAFTKDFKSHV